MSTSVLVAFVTAMVTARHASSYSVTSTTIAMSAATPRIDGEGRALSNRDSTTSRTSSSSSSSSPRFRYGVPLPESTYAQVLESWDCEDVCGRLRARFDDLYRDPRDPTCAGRRFAWDPWRVGCAEGRNGEEAPLPGDLLGEPRSSVVEGEREAAARQTQYCFARTPAADFFANDDDDDDDAYDELVDRLLALGRSVGLRATSPPWLTAYADGDSQNWHTDASHGPLAWSLSLTTATPPLLHGGETMMLRPEITDRYWSGDVSSSSSSSSGLEAPSIVRYLPPLFGRVLAFDPRSPHGVARVSTPSRDLREARLALVGWFSEPETTWEGSFDVDGVDGAALDAALEEATTILAEGDVGRVSGHLAVRLDVDADGTVAAVTAACDTLVADPDDHRGVVGYDAEDRPVMEDAPADVRLTVYEALREVSFSEAADDEEEEEKERFVVVPFTFE